jgi:hypothetical protein
MKHLFKDLGLPQRFSYLHIKRYNEENSIIFISESINSERPPDMPVDAELMNIKKSIIKCNVITPHRIKFECNIIFDISVIVPTVAEKLIGLILYKIFNRVKQFIENVTM